MSNTFRLPFQNVYGNKRKPCNNNMNGTSSSDKENQAMQNTNNAFATPDEDDFFENDDDDLLIAASQQVAMEIVKEKEPRNQVYNIQSLQGQVSILRDELERARREKDDMHMRHLNESKTTEHRFKKDLTSLKSKLEFKDRDIDELKAKVTRLEQDKKCNSPVHAPKRPRLSTVTTKSIKSDNRTSNKINKNRLAGYQSSPQCSALSNFSSLNLNESEECPAHRKVLMLYRSLCNNSTVKHNFNIYKITDKHKLTHNNTELIKGLFVQLRDVALSWHTKELIFKILAVILPYNEYRSLQEEIKHILELLRTKHGERITAATKTESSSIQHQNSTLQQNTTSQQNTTPKQKLDVVCPMLCSSKFDVFSLCTRSSDCPILALYSSQTATLSLLHLLQQLAPFSVFTACVCSDKLVQYLCNIIHGCIQGDLFASNLSYSHENLISNSLQVLVFLSPKFSDMAISNSTKTIYYAMLDVVKKLPLIENLSLAAKIDTLYEACFDLNNSMSAD